MSTFFTERDNYSGVIYSSLLDNGCGHTGLFEFSSFLPWIPIRSNSSITLTHLVKGAYAGCTQGDPPSDLCYLKGSIFSGFLASSDKLWNFLVWLLPTRDRLLQEGFCVCHFFFFWQLSRCTLTQLHTQKMNGYCVQGFYTGLSMGFGGWWGGGSRYGRLRRVVPLIYCSPPKIAATTTSRFMRL